MEDVGIENETFIRPSKIEVRGRDEGDNHDEEREREKRQKVEGGGGVGGGSGGGGGLLDNLLAKLASPRTPKAIGDQVFEGNTNHSDDNDDACVQGSGDGDSSGGGEGSESGGGGVINLISSLFHRSSEGEGEGEEDVKKNSNDGSEESLECKNESKKAEEESEGGGGGGGGGGNSNGGTSFISSLVQDAAAPEADEASILIHSIIHD
ncbi:hypothetical protein SOVF_067890 [Spinacia oleracea]|nr:hypothetical protein SOVF_067890 [Spinacia oleracea]